CDRDSQSEIIVPVGSGYLYAIDQVSQAELFSSYEDIMFTDPSPYNTSTISIFVTIYNEGGIDAKNVTVSFFDGPSLIGNTTINVSKASNNYTYINWHAVPSGYHTIVIKIDPNNEILELSEENNIYTKKIYVRPIPEFWILRDEIEFEPRYPKWNDINKVNVTVHNTGEINYKARVSIVDSSISGELAFDYAIVPVGGWVNVTLQFTPTQPQLPRVISIVVDYGNKVFEMNETNNSVEYTWRYGVSIQC
ncbi:MAG: CARDB domain-containing protein, partial [Thermoplasmata archaeon]